MNPAGSVFFHITQGTAILFVVGWALLQFVWQGAAVALLLRMVLGALRGSGANSRYLASYAALLLMMGVLVGDFAVAPRSPGVTVAASSSSSTRIQDTGPAAVAARASGLAPLQGAASHSAIRQPAAGSGVSAWWDQNGATVLPWLAGAWLLGVALLSVRLLIGWAGISRAAGRAVGSEATESWSKMLPNVARQLGVLRPIRVLESALVSAPGIIGWLRPVILIPVSMATALSPAQVEAILAHEIAHIRRHDYLVNLVQLLAETILFYHPAVWWVSRRIRVEREQCCDDMVVAALQNPRAYAGALAAVARLSVAGPAMALHANDGLLLARIRRILGLDPQQESTPPAPLAAAVCTVIIFTLMMLAGGGRLQAANPSQTSHVGTPSVRPDPVSAARTNTARPQPRRREGILYVTGQVLYEDGKPVPGAVVALYRGLVLAPATTTQSLTNGSFILKVPRAGRYRLMASQEGTILARSVVEVGSTPIRTLRLVAHRLQPATATASEEIPVTPVEMAGGAANINIAPPGVEPLRTVNPPVAAAIAIQSAPTVPAAGAAAGSPAARIAPARAPVAESAAAQPTSGTAASAGNPPRPDLEPGSEQTALANTLPPGLPGTSSKPAPEGSVRASMTHGGGRTRTRSGANVIAGDRVPPARSGDEGTPFGVAFRDGKPVLTPQPAIGSGDHVFVHASTGDASSALPVVVVDGGIRLNPSAAR